MTKHIPIQIFACPFCLNPGILATLTVQIDSNPITNTIILITNIVISSHQSRCIHAVISYIHKDHEPNSLRYNL